jgi:hypothetical protein
MVFDSTNLRLRKGVDPVSGEVRYEIMKKEFVAVVGSVQEFSNSCLIALRGMGTGNTGRR